MVFVFGLDVPLIEMFVILSLLVLVSIACLIALLLKQTKINTKLDSMMKEEHEIKEELDLTKMEEDKQLLFMKKLIEELGQLNLVSGKKKEELRQLVDISTATQSLGPDQQLRMMQRMMAQIAQVDRVVAKESTQLDYIQGLIEKTGKQFSSTRAELAKKEKALNRATAFNKVRDIK